MADIYGTSSNDNGIDKKKLVGTNKPDSIYGKAGNDILLGLDGNDWLHGGADNDVLDGGADNDILEGDAGDDTLYGRTGGDHLYGGSGDDYLVGGGGGGSDNDVLVDDYLVGGRGNDILLGGPGFDFLEGYSYGQNESDTLTGGSDKDLFVLADLSYDDSVYYLGNGYATITDFSLDETDQIQIGGSIADGYSLGLGNWEGSNAQDTGIFYKGDLIGVVQDKNITNVNQNEVFISLKVI